ncbi:hypothetical protein MRX96_043253 [Rhipicephalus microplus]
MDDSCESAMQSASLLCPVEQRVLMFRCGRGIKGSAVRRAQKGITAELGSNANADGVSLDAFCVGVPEPRAREKYLTLVRVFENCGEKSSELSYLLCLFTRLGLWNLK